MGSQVPEVEIGESTVRFSDGLVINLADIKEIKAPQVVLGAPNHPLTKAIASCLEQGQALSTSSMLRDKDLPPG